MRGKIKLLFIIFIELVSPNDHKKWYSTFIEGVFAYDEFHKACVMTHNKLRKLHGAQALAYSEELGVEAQKWCEELAIKDELSHDNRTMDTKGEGENLAATPVTGTKSEGATPDLCILAVQKWYAEEQNYNYQTGLPKAPGMPIKHFAQVNQEKDFMANILVSYAYFQSLVLNVALIHVLSLLIRY